MKNRTFFERIKKSLNSLAMVTLLLPNLMSLGVVAAEEAPVEEPEVEEVEAAVEEPEIVEETPAPAEETTEEITEEEPAAVEEAPEVETPAPEEPATVEEPAAEEVAPAQATGIVQENLVYENGILTLHNQVEGTNIAAVLPNGSLIYALVPFHGRWSPRQNLARNKIYVGDEIEFFTYSGTDLGESIFLTVEGDGETRPADQYAVQYSRQHFGYIPTERDTSITYRTEPFFLVEMTFPNGAVETKRASALGQVRFYFSENNYTTGPGHVFSVRVFDRNNNLIDLRDPNLFATPDRNQIETRIPGDPIPATHTVTIDPNGGTIDEAFASTEITEGETYTVPYSFQSNLARPGYTLTGYTVEGTLLDANGNAVTEIPRFTSTYTPQSDVTLTANWEVTSGGFRILLYDDNPAAQKDNYTVKLVAEDATEYVLSTNQRSRDYATWTIDGVPNGNYTLVIDGYNISEGEKFGQPDTTSAFTVNDDGTATVELEFVDDKSTTFIRYRVYGEPIPATHTVTIDSNGGTINEAYASTEVTEGETYTVPYTFQSGLARPGYTLTGYSVEGTLLDANGNPVSELSRFTGVYTPMSDVTLTANWEVTSGGFRLRDRVGNFITADRSFALTDGENTYPLTSNSYTNQFRTWTVDNVPNGVYTLLVDGLAYPEEWNLETTNPNSSATIAADGTVTVDLTFADNSSTTFVRFDLTMNEYEVGVEVRDLNNRRTSDVGIRIENDEGTVFEGSFDQYNLWTTNATVLPGDYTITLTTPDGTLAEINDTVASQVAEPTDEPNVFTIAVNKASRGNLSRVFGAFRLVEAPAEIETHPLGIEVRDLNGRRTSDVTVFVQNEDLVVFRGSFNQYAQWLSDEELPVGEYTITLRTPADTYAVVQDTTQQHAQPTDRRNVFTIEINRENRGNLSRVFGAFQLVAREYRLGIEVRGLDGRRTDDVGVLVTSESGEIFAGSFNQYLQWLTTEELPAGEYVISLSTPDGTVAEVNDSTNNFAQPTDTENVFTIQLNEANLGSSMAIYGAFRLAVVEPVETYEDITTTETIPYETTYRTNSKLPLGERRVVQVGVEGTRSVTERVYYEDGVEVRREIIDESTTQAVTEIVEIGTKVSLRNIVKKVVSVVTKVVKSIFSWFF